MSTRIIVVALCALLLGLVFGPTSGSSAEPDGLKLDPNLPYQAKRSHPVTYEVDFAVVVTAPYHTKKLKVWLPLPQCCSRV